jgi:hypothetical protein
MLCVRIGALRIFWWCLTLIHLVDSGVDHKYKLMYCYILKFSKKHWKVVNLNKTGPHEMASYPTLRY